MPGSPGWLPGPTCVSPTDVVEALIIASGPPGARLAIAISAEAHGEFHGPITPITLRSAVYARMLATTSRPPGPGEIGVVAGLVADREPTGAEAALAQREHDRLLELRGRVVQSGVAPKRQIGDDQVARSGARRGVDRRALRVGQRLSLRAGWSAGGEASGGTRGARGDPHSSRADADVV